MGIAWWLAAEGRMHGLSFQFKRAHWRAVARGRVFTEPCGLTPARFDLMYLVQQHFFGAPKQSDLRRALGVARVTVSRMVRRLEELGLVKRSESTDRRTKCVSLTPEGATRLRVCIALLRETRVFQLFYELAHRGPSETAAMCVENLFVSVRQVARFLGDTSTLHYATGHPDD